MRLISVASPGNGSGKTRLIESIGRTWPGRFAAVKFTTVFRDGKFCPKDQQRQCACSRLHDEYNVITDAATIAQENTDTGRITAAGIAPVIWALARPGAHASAWAHVRELLPQDAEVLTEGNTALLSVASDVLLFVVNPCVPVKFWKSNWRELCARAQAVIVNEAPEAVGKRPVAPVETRPAILAEAQAAAPETPRIVARLDAPLRDWAGPFLEALIEGPVSLGIGSPAT